MVVIADSEDDELAPYVLDAQACGGCDAPQRPLNAAAAAAAEGRPSGEAALSPWSPQPTTLLQQLQQQAVAQRAADRLPVQPQRLFPGLTDTLLRWDDGGRLTVAPPPCLDALLAGTLAEEKGALLEDSHQAQMGDQAAEAGVAVSTPTPSQQPVLPPLLVADGLLLPPLPGQQPDSSGGKPPRQLLRFDDPGAHRWAFLAAFNAQEQEEEQPPARAQQGAEGPAAAEQGDQSGDVAAAHAAANKASRGSKPRKRKQAASDAAAPVAAAAGAGGAAAAKPKKRKVG